MTRMTGFLFLSLLVAGASALADSACLNVRLDQNGGRLERIPVSDQGATNLCFGYAATTLVDSERVTRPNYTPLDPLELTTHTIAKYSHDKSRPSDVYGGWIDQAIEVAQSEGAQLPMLQTVSRPDLKTEDLHLQIQTQLAKGKPTAVNFCAEVVMNRYWSPSSISGGFVTCARHYAIVIGEEPAAAGGCRFLVRDSQCNQYIDKKTGAARCEENGQFWIDADPLLVNTESLIYFN